MRVLLICTSIALLVILGCDTKSGSTSECYQQANTAEFEKLLEKKGNNFLLIDVRTPEEYDDGHIAGSINMDVQSGDFIEEVKSIDKNKKIYLYCRSGSRSTTASNILLEKGFCDIYELDGGILKWEEEGNEVVR